MTGGISIIERQVRQVRAAGAARVIVLAEKMPARLAGALEHARGPRHDLEIARSPKELERLLPAAGDVLVLEEGLVIDQRALAAVTAHPAPVLATWPGAAPSVPAAASPRLEHATRIDAQTLFAGVAKLPAPRLHAILPTLGDWDLLHTLLRAEVGEGEAARLDLAALDQYAPDLRRRQPIVWAKPQDEAEAAAATDMLLAAAQKGCLDWPARFIHPPIENALVRLLLPTAVTPNMVTLATALIGVAAAACFASGWLWAGLMLALATGPLDGVDGKLARVGFEFSQWGDLEHVLDKLVEYSWYLCLAWHFSSAERNAGAWPLAAIIILFALAEAAQGEFFRRFTGRQLDDAGPFERRYRLISGRRNTFFWLLVPFAAAGLWFAGFVVIAAYSALNFFVMQWSFFSRLRAYGREHSDVIDANFRETAYGFLPRVGR